GARAELAGGARVGDPRAPRLPALGQGARAVAADEDAVPVGGRARIVPALETDAHASMIQRSGEDSYSRATSALSAVVRKNVAPASSRQTVLLTQKELSRLTCRRDAGATILSHDLLCGEISFGCGWVFICGFLL